MRLSCRCLSTCAVSDRPRGDLEPPSGLGLAAAASRLLGHCSLLGRWSLGGWVSGQWLAGHLELAFGKVIGIVIPGKVRHFPDFS